MNKRGVILAGLIVLVIASFWLTSRYPAIDEKAAMAGDTVLEDALSFEAHFPVEDAYPLGKKILYSTANWIWTNKEGMTFGVILAALVLTLLRLFPARDSRHPLLNTLKGTLFGAPLGVCVNCAAPIAQSMYRGGARMETSLATMLSSPTLNIVVLTMTFSLFPLYMAAAKLVITLLFILLLMPLLLRLVLRGERAAPAPCDPCPAPGAETWFQALSGTARDLLGNFWYVCIRTVPLMLVAGLLGTTMAILLPLESLFDRNVTFSGLALVALLGTFLPVPIAFDVVVVQTLLVAGLDPAFAMVLLITLGLFSIYPFFLVWNAMSRSVAVALFFAVASTGIGAGYLAQGYERYEVAQAVEQFTAHFAGRPDTRTEQQGARPAVQAAIAPAPKIVRQAWYRAGNIHIERTDFAARAAVPGLPFSQRAGRDLGLDYADVSTLDFLTPFSQGRGITSADFDRDGWTDLALAGNNGVLLYRNLGTSRFAQVTLELPEIAHLNILLVAFVDIDSDGWQDLFLGAFGDTDYFVINDRQGFRQPVLQALPHQGALFTQAAAFYDIDKDADLDLVKGSWFFLIPRTFPSARATNYRVINDAGTFRQHALEEIPGETLTTLIADINSDGHADMIIGNDFQEPDIYYLGRADGSPEKLRSGGVIPISTLATMSIDSADYNNDLVFDLYLTGKVNDFSFRRDALREEPTDIHERRRIAIGKRRKFEKDYCLEIGHAADRKRCQAALIKGNMLRKRELTKCKTLSTRPEQDECIATVYMQISIVKRDKTLCVSIPENFPAQQMICESFFAYLETGLKKPGDYRYLDKGAITQAEQGNVLLRGNRHGNFTSVGEEQGVYDGVWAWNARFADLDNDEWQDIYVANGWWLETRLYSNKFFHNQGGEGFVAAERAFGLENNLKQSAYTYIDIDNDGDLDIISVAMHGYLSVHINNEYENNRIGFEFDDELGNRSGIGNKVYIYYGTGNTRHQVREIKAGGGFLSYDAAYAHFGLGAYKRINKVEVVWSTGEKTVIDRPFDANGRYLIRRRQIQDTAPETVASPGWFSRQALQRLSSSIHQNQ